MSMTKEEAFKILSDLRPGCGKKPIYTEGEKCEAFDMAFSALRPITREQVEKVWRGSGKKNALLVSLKVGNTESVEDIPPKNQCGVPNAEKP